MRDESRNKVYMAFTFALVLLVLVGGWIAFRPKYQRYRQLKATDDAKRREIEEMERQIADKNSMTERLGRDGEYVEDLQQGRGRYKANVDVIDFGRTKRQ